MPDPRNGDDVRGDLVVEVAVALTRDHDQAVRRERAAARGLCPRDTAGRDPARGTGRPACGMTGPFDSALPRRCSEEPAG